MENMKKRFLKKDELILVCAQISDVHMYVKILTPFPVN